MNFTRYQKTFSLLSVAVILALFGITFYHYGGFARSLAFDGGIRISLRLPPQMSKPELSAALSKAGFPEAVIRLSDPRTNTWDLELGPQVRSKVAQELRKREAQQKKRKTKNRTLDSIIDSPDTKRSISISDEIEKRLLKIMKLPRENVVASESIAASYGENLSKVALRILIYTIIGIALYLSFRFDFPFAVGASAALIHDLLFTLGIIGVARIEPSIPVLAAVLTVLGYSINDTIVIFDRIRENAEERSQATSKATINLSLTQTLSRTLVTSVLTLLAVAALLLGGERSLRDFAIVVIVGVLIGTYSSVFIATPCVRYYEKLRNRRR